MKIKESTKDFLFLLLIGFFTVVSYFSSNSSIMLLIVVFIFALAIRYTLNDFNKHIFLLCFLACYAIFLLIGQVLTYLMNIYDFKYNDNIEIHTNYILLIGLFGLLVGYVFTNRFSIKTTIEKHSDFNSPEYIFVRDISKKAFYLLYVFWIIVLLDRVLFVYRNGYVQYYLNYQPTINVFVRYLGYLAPSAFFVFLATMPSRGEIRFPVIMYVVYLLLSIGTGRRIIAIGGLLIIFAYYVCRNKINPGEKKWITKNAIIIILLFIPVLLALLYLFEYIRSGFYVGKADSYNPVFGFFVRQGTSINVIKLSEYYKIRLDPSAKYSLYNTIRWIQDSPLNIFFGFDFSFGNQSVYTATHGTKLADFVSYNNNNTSYLLGLGWGSCYLEELYIDFGYIGVFIGSLIYGSLLRTTLKSITDRNNIWLTALCLLITDSLFRAPRAEFDAFIRQVLYFEQWGMIIIIYFITKMYRNRKSFRFSHND